MLSLCLNMEGKLKRMMEVLLRQLFTDMGRIESSGLTIEIDSGSHLNQTKSQSSTLLLKHNKRRCSYICNYKSEIACQC